MSEEKIENVEEEINEKTEENGVQISDDVVAVIAGKAASEVSGVFSMAGGFAGGIKNEIFRKIIFSNIFSNNISFIINNVFISFWMDKSINSALSITNSTIYTNSNKYNVSSISSINVTSN